MKKHSLLITVLLVVALLALTNSIAAAGNGPVGTRITLNPSPPPTFPAETPFHIYHGWVQSSEDGAIGIFDFKLEVDGVLLKEDFNMFSAVSGDPDTLYRIRLYNFPNGMTGVHTFTGHWFAPCQYAVDEMGYPGPCVTPNAKVEVNTQTRIITFIP